MEANGLEGGLPLGGLLGRADEEGWVPSALELEPPLVLAACPDALLSSSGSCSLLLSPGWLPTVGAWVGIGASDWATL